MSDILLAEAPETQTQPGPDAVPPNMGTSGPHTITITYDPDIQGISAINATSYFRSLEFMVAVLVMAKTTLESQVRTAQAIAARQAMAEQAQAQALSQSLRGDFGRKQRFSVN